MYRRFGIPPLGADDYKDLCGGWMLSTPSTKLLVWVKPSLSGAHFSFTPIYLRSETELSSKARHIDDLALPAATIAELEAAYRGLLLDLLRPVAVRDAHFNAIGDVSDDSPLMRCDKDGEPVYQVERHASSGFGVPPGLVGSASWTDLCGLINRAGNGSAPDGCAAIVEQLRSPIAKEVGKLARPVQRLVLLGAEIENVKLQHLLEIDETQRDALTADIAMMLRPVPDSSQAEASQAMKTLIQECTDDAIAQAVEMLQRLAISSDRLKRLLTQTRELVAIHAAWRELEGCGDGDFPFEALLPEVEDRRQLAAGVRERFIDAGHPALADWVDRTLAGPFGEVALHRIVLHLESMAKERPRMRA